MKRALAAMLVALGACAQAPLEDSLIPGTIGVSVRQENAQVIVAAVGKSSPASGVRVGDVVLRYNGETVSSSRQFYRLVVDSPPGSLARLEVMREGAVRMLEIPVRELDLMPRA